MRLPAEILAEFAPDEWTAREWRAAHDAIRQAQIETRDELLEALRMLLNNHRIRMEAGDYELDSLRSFHNAARMMVGT